MSIAGQRCDDLRRDGFLVMKRFYDIDRDIRPIRESIRSIVDILLKKHSLKSACASPLEAMTQGYLSLIAADRRWGGHAYDAVKQIPAFLSLVACKRNADLFAELRPGSMPGIAGGGFGIRIDNPNEEKYRADWHQEFPAQLRSVDGLVFWSPLLELTQAMGPVEIAVASHLEGIIPVHSDAGAANQTGAYALRLDDLEARLARFQRVAPVTEPGDLIIMDFLTIHRSGRNVSDRPRWSMQFRYFNFLDPTGIDMEWSGSFAAGTNFAELLPQLAARKNAT